MTKDEFINSACRMGYCNKEQADLYIKLHCKDKEIFTDDDYIEVYRFVEERRYIP